MTKLNGWKMASALFTLCVATAIPSPGQTFTTLVNFDSTDGAQPAFTSLTQGADGSLYGTTSAGGETNSGTVFRIARNGSLTTMHSFCLQSGCTDGVMPYPGLALGADGNLYGAAYRGGSNACLCGTVFRITPAGTFTTLHSFAGAPNEGAQPLGRLILAVDGNFYGTTHYAGANNSCFQGCGTLFKISPSGAFTTLHSFDGTDGNGPQGALAQGTDGDFYGAAGGGANNCACGTVFRMTPAGKVTTLHSFDMTDGSYPTGGVIQATDGNLYGTTSQGGANVLECGVGCGTIFKIALGGNFATLYSFCSQPNCSDGFGSDGGLLQGTNGALYGTTTRGGNTCGAITCGTVFAITLRGSLSTLHSFDGADGETPEGQLLQATNGSFYATTFDGGANLLGTVFSLGVGLKPFLTFVRAAGSIGQTAGILGQGLSGTTSVSFNGTPAKFSAKSATLLTATVPPGATTGYVTVTTPTGLLTSNVPFQVIP